jgi:Tol biopolymer transport system component
MAYVALAAAWMIPAGAAMAAKPSAGGGGGGSTGGGTIWFRADNGGATQLYTMNSDGTGVAASTHSLQWSIDYATHGGHRWYRQRIGITGETYPDGRTRVELFAVRDDGVSVQLTSQPDLQFQGSIGDCAAWVPDGARLAWTAKRWVNGAVVDGGLYVADLAFDSDGNITGLAAQPAAPALRRPIVNGSADITEFSWAPDAARFVYVKQAPAGSSTVDIDVADLSGTDRLLVSATAAVGAKWSPDGSKILYYEDHTRAWHVTSPDGSGNVKVIGNKPSTSTYGAMWSPTGSHIVYAFQPDNYVNAYSLYRVPVSGGQGVNLTPQFTHAMAVGWTQ